jgi:hypothetical protein
MNLEWAIAARPASGQSTSADLHVVQAFPGGVLVAVIDGLGRGTDATDTARRAADTLLEEPGAPIDALLRRCHERLKDTPGATMSLARFDIAQAQLTWSGVGNVAAVLLRADLTARPVRHELPVFGGVVGGALAGIRTATLPLERGDLVLLATEGLKAGFADDVDRHGAVKAIAAHALANCGRDSDDALVLVVRWLARSVP